MDEDVVDRMTSLKLTAEEEEDIQVSEEGRVDELEGCVLSLIGKFLTCKPYNRKAAKNTLRRAWGLEEGLQISKVGSNLFQFKFQSGLEEVMNADSNRDAEPKYYKRTKGDKEDGKAENSSAGVDDHPCREQ